MSDAAQPAQFDEAGLLYSRQFDDHYFSRIDGRAECAHVFIDGNDLPLRWRQQSEQTDTHGQNFAIGELGFGTGLNFLETWRQWRDIRQPGQHLSFLSVEGFPLAAETAGQALKNWPELGALSARLLERWDQMTSPMQLDDQTRLQVLQGDVTDMVVQFPLVDAWYLDGFSPANNPEMWGGDLLRSVFERSVVGGTFASYTAAGWVRRNLESAGFMVEKRTGFGSKRHMIAGRRL